MAAVATKVLLDDVRARGGPDDDNVPVVDALQQALAQGRGLTRRLLQFSRQQQGQPRETVTITVDAFETTAHDGGGDGLPAGGWVRLSAVDTGCGMSPEVRERIFEPFCTTKADDSDTGPGLPTVFGIVHGVGGRIAVTSSPGAGSTFRLAFPATKAG